jgi:hypothetical protein
MTALRNQWIVHKLRQANFLIFDTRPAPCVTFRHIRMDFRLGSSTNDIKVFRGGFKDFVTTVCEI